MDKEIGQAFEAIRRENREKNLSIFEDKWLHKVRMVYLVEKRDNGSYSIPNKQFGVVDYFPKKDRLLIRKDKKWVSQGLDWILKNLLYV